jgi:hypothetical protein
MEVINQPHRHVAATLVLVLAASPLVAHHGWSDVDQTKVINLTGTVKRLGFENPHVFIELEVPDRIWRVQLVSPGTLQQRGVTRDMLKPGTTLTLAGFPHKRERNEMRAEKITGGEKTVSMRRVP